MPSLRLPLSRLAGLASAALICLTSRANAADDSRRYDDGTRWGFVSDKASARGAVIDTFSQKINKRVDELRLQAIPGHIVFSDMQSLIA